MGVKLTKEWTDKSADIDLGSFNTFCLLVLCVNANDNTSRCNLSFGEMATLMQCSVRTVMRAIKHLSRVGLIGIRRRRGGINIYTVLADFTPFYQKQTKRVLTPRREDFEDEEEGDEIVRTEPEVDDEPFY